MLNLQDRVVVAKTSPLSNLIGREGTVVRHLPEHPMTGPEMFEVLLDNLLLAPKCVFYPCELIKLSKEQ